MDRWLLALFVSMSLSFSATAADRLATYAAVGFDGKVIFSNYVSFSIRGGMFEGDTVIPVKYCLESSGFICVQGAFPFAVPLSFTGAEKEWSFDGVDYTLVGAQSGMIAQEKNPFSIKIFGVDEKIFGVKSSYENIERVFFYSLKNGLIGFTGTLESPYYSLEETPYSTEAVYWLTSSCGIGCQQFEAEVIDSARASNVKNN